MYPSLKNSIIETTGYIPFTISLDTSSNIVYSGRIDQMPNQTSTSVDYDLAPILRQIIKPLDYSKVLNYNKSTGYYYDQNDYINTVYFNNSPFEITWSYADTNDVLGSGDLNFAVNYGITDDFYIGQYFPLNFWDDISAFGSADLIIHNSYSPDSFSSGNIIYEFDLNNYESFFVSGNCGSDRITQDLGKYIYWCSYGSDSILLSKVYNMNYCRPNNLMTLYYVNEYGGLCWCHFKMKNIESQEITRNQIEHNIVGDQTSQFGIDNYCVQSYKNYELNTDWLTDEQSKLIQWLFKSPKVWLQKYDEKDETKVVSVVITDTSVTHKNRNNDKLFNYTVNVRETYTENIYA